MPRQGRSRRRRGPTASLYGAWRSAKLGHWDRRPNATQSGNFKPVVLGEIHAAGNITLDEASDVIGTHAFDQIVAAIERRAQRYLDDLEARGV